MNYQFHHIDSCPSTNAQLKEDFLAGKAPLETVLVAKTQTHGRGRYDRKWLAPEGNLNASFLINTENNTKAPSVFNLMGGLAVCKAINKTSSLKAKIKWPNDVLINDRKVCGILSEFIVEKNAAIIGMGVNVNSRLIDFPTERQPAITTLYHETKNEIDLQTFLQNILNEFTHTEPTKLISEIHDHLAWLGQDVCVKKENTIIKGKLHGLDENGFLLIKKIDQSIETVMAGDLLRLASSV
ncbi:MAG: biotin--[acetyl-CoA-carboxylase] ligase [bacterium]|nr:biotin--[acetyl-CoA-carboxylase] ligase [bacterium]MBU1917744.1 biotin--[acetyl-CoA-carboxylase] ligase [bacterium]